MKREPELPNRRQAIESGLQWFGEIHDTYLMDGVSGRRIGHEPAGVSVHILSIEDKHPIDISHLERSNYKLNRLYERAVRKETKRAAEKIIRLSAS